MDTKTSKRNEYPENSRSTFNIWFVVLVVLILSLSVNGTLVSPDNSVAVSNNATSLPMYIGHSPIRINSNADFATMAAVEGWNGVGSQAEPWIIENYVIDGNGNHDCLYIGNTTDYFIVRNCHLYGAGKNTFPPYYPAAGLILNNVTNGQLCNNTIYDNRWGIIVKNFSSFNTIAYNHAYSNINEAIKIWFSNNNTIVNNTLDSNYWFGISLLYANNNTIFNNHASNHQDSYRIVSSNYNTITGNTASSNNDGGFFLHSSSGNTISNNQVFNSILYGFHIATSSNYNTFSNNTVRNNGRGFGLGVFCSGNNIFHNYIINNSLQAFDYDNNFWDNGYPSGGNYWSDYNGVDLYSGPNQNISGSDGIGDTPYTSIIGGSNVDNYPLMKPWAPEIITSTATGPQGAHHDPVITITYNWTESPSAVELYFSTNNGDSWNYLGTDNSVDGSYDWEPTANPEPKPTKYYWIANAKNGTDDVGIPVNGTPPEAGPFNWKTWDTCEDAPLPLSGTNPNWFFISVPLDISLDLISVFDDANWGDGGTTWDYIQWFDAADPSDPWKSYSIYRPPSLNDNVAIDNSMGFWIHLTANDGDGVLTVGEGVEPVSTTIILHAGWNLVGYPTMTEMIVADALWGTGADKVEVFDPAEPYRIREVGATYVMKPGEGYWVHVPADTVWVVDW